MFLMSVSLSPRSTPSPPPSPLFPVVASLQAHNRIKGTALVDGGGGGGYGGIKLLMYISIDAHVFLKFLQEREKLNFSQQVLSAIVD